MSCIAALRIRDNNKRLQIEGEETTFLINADTKRRSAFRKWRLNSSGKRKAFSKITRWCPGLTSFSDFLTALKTDQTVPNFVLKSVIGFLGGILLTYFCFMFFVFQLSISLRHATVMSTIIGVPLILGLAFSYRMRCLVFLLVPQFFSRVGRYTLTCYVLILILTGPAANTLRNSEVLTESMVCTQEYTKANMKPVSEPIKRPFESMQDAVKLLIDEVKNVAMKMQDKIVKLHRLVTGIVNVIQSGFAWLSSTVRSCNYHFGKPYKRCLQSLKRGCAICKSKFGPNSSQCELEDVVGVCSHVKSTNRICVSTQFIRGSVAASVKKKLEIFTERVNSMLQLKVNFHGLYSFNRNGNRTANQLTSGIVTDIRNKADPLLTWLSWSSCVTSLFLVLIIFRAKYYQQTFETRSRFDNRYITKELRDLDLTRLRQGRETVLPLNRRERAKYVATVSLRLLASEKTYLSRSVFFMIITTFKLLIHMIADYSLYWVLITIRYHGRMQSQLQPGVPDVGVRVTGSSFLVLFFNSLIRSLSVPIMLPVPSQVPCLPNPHPPDLQRNMQIGVLIILLWFFALFEPYGLRLRHVIMGLYRPERAKARASWLYNHILRTRGGFMKSVRRKLHREYKYSTEERLTFRHWLDLRLPCSYLRPLFGVCPNEPHCLLCGIKKRPKNRSNIIRCETLNCPGAYCSSCFSDIGQLCTICMNPADYGDISDVSLEKDSSQESSDDENIFDKQKRSNLKKNVNEPKNKKSDKANSRTDRSEHKRNDCFSNKTKNKTLFKTYPVLKQNYNEDYKFKGTYQKPDINEISYLHKNQDYGSVANNEKQKYDVFNVVLRNKFSNLTDNAFGNLISDLIKGNINENLILKGERGKDENNSKKSEVSALYLNKTEDACYNNLQQNINCQIDRKNKNTSISNKETHSKEFESKINRKSRKRKISKPNNDCIKLRDKNINENVYSKNNKRTKKKHILFKKKTNVKRIHTGINAFLKCSVFILKRSFFSNLYDINGNLSRVSITRVVQPSSIVKDLRNKFKKVVRKRKHVADNNRNKVKTFVQTRLQTRSIPFNSKIIKNVNKHSHVSLVGPNNKDVVSKDLSKDHSDHNKVEMNEEQKPEMSKNSGSSKVRHLKCCDYWNNFKSLTSSTRWKNIMKKMFSPFPVEWSNYKSRKKKNLNDFSGTSLEKAKKVNEEERKFRTSTYTAEQEWIRNQQEINQDIQKALSKSTTELENRFEKKKSEYFKVVDEAGQSEAFVWDVSVKAKKCPCKDNKCIYKGNFDGSKLNHECYADGDDNNYHNNVDIGNLRNNGKARISKCDIPKMKDLNPIAAKTRKSKSDKNMQTGKRMANKLKDAEINAVCKTRTCASQYKSACKEAATTPLIKVQNTSVQYSNPPITDKLKSNGKNEQSTSGSETKTDTTVCSDVTLEYVDETSNKRNKRFRVKVVTKANQSTETEKSNFCDVSTITSDWWSPIVERKEKKASLEKKTSLEKRREGRAVHINRRRKKATANIAVSTEEKNVKFKSQPQLIPLDVEDDNLTPSKYLLESQKYYNELFAPRYNFSHELPLRAFKTQNKLIQKDRTLGLGCSLDG